MLVDPVESFLDFPCGEVSVDCQGRQLGFVFTGFQRVSWFLCSTCSVLKFY